MAQDLFTLLYLSLALTLAVHAQNQTEFISIDCGLVGKSSYKDETTSIIYTSDYSFIESGEIHSISSEYKAKKSLERQFWNVRSFPEGNRNCYGFSTSLLSDSKGGISSNQYIIRARFLYGNYDHKNSLPKFDVYIGTKWWDTVEFESADIVVTKEVIYTALSTNIHVCFCNTNQGTPFVSVLEIRALNFSAYEESHLQLFARFDLGSQDGKVVRYPDDSYDRIWTPYNSNEWTQISTSSTIDTNSYGQSLPSRIMRTAVTPANGGENFYLRTNYNASSYNTYLHFAELEKLKPNQTREFDIIINGVQHDYPVIQPMYLTSTSYLERNKTNADKNLEVLIKRSNTSSLPPILNAIEIYSIKDLSQLVTSKREYDAMMNIKSLYGIKRNWQGDPCNPKDYIWEGLNCRNVDGFISPAITYLNLSSSGLVGDISDDLLSLKHLEYLDLSHNKLTGFIPVFLSSLDSLKVLKLEGNNLSEVVPSELIEKSPKGFLQFSYEGNPGLCNPSGCYERRRNNKMVVSIITLVGGAIIVFGAIAFYFFKAIELNKEYVSN